jgi:hypothetical protein
VRGAGCGVRLAGGGRVVAVGSWGGRSGGSAHEMVREEPMMRLATCGSPLAKASAARLVVAAPITEQKKAT